MMVVSCYMNTGIKKCNVGKNTTYIHSIDPYVCHKTIGCVTHHKHINI